MKEYIAFYEDSTIIGGVGVAKQTEIQSGIGWTFSFHPLQASGLETGELLVDRGTLLVRNNGTLLDPDGEVTSILVRGNARVGRLANETACLTLEDARVVVGEGSGVGAFVRRIAWYCIVDLRSGSILNVSTDAVLGVDEGGDGTLTLQLSTMSVGNIMRVARAGNASGRVTVSSSLFTLGLGGATRNDAHLIWLQIFRSG